MEAEEGLETELWKLQEQKHSKTLRETPLGLLGFWGGCQAPPESAPAGESLALGVFLPLKVGSFLGLVTQRKKWV